MEAVQLLTCLSSKLSCAAIMMYVTRKFVYGALRKGCWPLVWTRLAPRHFDDMFMCTRLVSEVPHDDVSVQRGRTLISWVSFCFSTAVQDLLLESAALGNKDESEDISKQTWNHGRVLFTLHFGVSDLASHSSIPRSRYEKQADLA